MTYRHSLYLAPLLYLFAFLISAIKPATAATFVVTNTADAGLGSLRQAIQSANSLPGPDLIQFNIPGTGVHTIVAGSDLPFVTDALTIDGTSQPGYSGKPLIVPHRPRWPNRLWTRAHPGKLCGPSAHH